MKTSIRISTLLMLTSVLYMACQKEVSLEQGNTTPSVGSLSVDGTGNCLGAVISGAYYKDTIIMASNYADVSVQVDTAGTYNISTDTVNGYYFKATGTFTTTGVQVIRLVGGGKPLAAGTNIFTVSYNGTFCQFTVTVTAQPPPSGGSAAFTINCTGPTLAGTYMAGTALTAANTITLNVNVTTIGTWSVTTAPAVNGIAFSGTGTFATTGAQTIVLTGTGTPTAAGTNTYTVTGGAATCTFQVTVIPGASPDYFPRTAYSNWSYQFDGDPLDSFLVKVLPNTHSASGNTYAIFMATDDVSSVPSFDTLGYYRRNGGNYFEWGDISWGILNNPYRIEYIFLKDDQVAGHSWSSPEFTGAYTDQGSGQTFNVTLRWDLTILQQNTTVTVGSTQYANTIKVKQEFKQIAGTNTTVIYYMENYFARGKGLIKQDFFQASGTPFYAQEARRIVIY